MGATEAPLERQYGMCITAQVPCVARPRVLHECHGGGTSLNLSDGIVAFPHGCFSHRNYFTPRRRKVPYGPGTSTPALAANIMEPPPLLPLDVPVPLPIQTMPLRLRQVAARTQEIQRCYHVRKPRRIMDPRPRIENSREYSRPPLMHDDLVVRYYWPQL